MALYGPIYRTLLKMSRSNELKEQGFACPSGATESQLGDSGASVPSPVELGSLVFACPLPRCEIERNAGSCRADPTQSSARWPARVNLAAFWQQIVPIVPFCRLYQLLSTVPSVIYRLPHTLTRKRVLVRIQSCLPYFSITYGKTSKNAIR